MDNVEAMDKFLERYNLPKMNQEEIENMNRPITITEVETVILKIQTGTSLVATVFKNPPANAGDTSSSPGPGRSHMPWSN